MLGPGAEGDVILVSSRDRLIQFAVGRVARPDEAVVVDPDWIDEALAHGFARLVVCDDEGTLPTSLGRHVPTLHVSCGLLRSWERERARSEVPAPRVVYVAERLRPWVARAAVPATWVDRLIGDLSRATGGVLPLPFRAFARHALELPSRYTDLRAHAALSGLSRGALKARFRRRGLGSPFTYLRWLRALAVAEVLSDADVTVAAAAQALGFTSDTNMCRMVRAVTGVTPGRLRESGARRELLLAFASRCLAPSQLESWNGLVDLFERRVA
jgi:AraC-like DNA-binding protein